jgi:tetratricopeptide (TPR) repeat protein
MEKHSASMDIPDKRDIINGGDYKTLITCLAEAREDRSCSNDYILMAERVSNDFRKWAGAEYEEMNPTEKAEKLFHFTWDEINRIAEADYGAILGSLKDHYNGIATGNCRSFTGVYTILAMIEELDAGVLLSDDCNMDGTHHMRSFIDGDQVIEIENTHPDGFDVGNKEKDPVFKYTKHGPASLVSLEFDSIGNEARRNGDHKKAIECYKKSVFFDVTNYTPFMNLGITFSALGDFKRAMNYFDRAIEINPNASKIYNYRAEMFECMGDLNNARKDFWKALKLNPVSHHVLDQTAKLEVKFDNLETAAELSGLAFEIKPIAGYLITQANIQMALGNYKKATEISKRALDRLEKVISNQSTPA